MEWVAEEAVQAGGSASVWLGRPGSATQEHELAKQMAERISDEYELVIGHAATALEADVSERRRILARPRREVRRIESRDSFPPRERGQARAAVRALAHVVDAGA